MSSRRSSSRVKSRVVPLPRCGSRPPSRGTPRTGRRRCGGRRTRPGRRRRRRRPASRRSCSPGRGAPAGPCARPCRCRPPHPRGSKVWPSPRWASTSGPVSGSGASRAVLFSHVPATSSTSAARTTRRTRRGRRGSGVGEGADEGVSDMTGLCQRGGTARAVPAAGRRAAPGVRAARRAPGPGPRATPRRSTRRGRTAGRRRAPGASAGTSAPARGRRRRAGGTRRGSRR